MRAISKSLFVMSLALTVLAGPFLARETYAGPSGWFDRESLCLERARDGLVLKCRVVNSRNETVSALLDVSVRTLDGDVLLRSRQTKQLRTGRNDLKVVLSGAFDDGQAPKCVLKYGLRAPGVREDAACSLMSVLPQLETRVVSFTDFQAGTQAGVRLVAVDHASGLPVEGADVKISLATDESERTLLATQTDADGTIDARFDVPNDVTGQAELRIAVTAKGLGDDRLTVPVTVERDTKILLTTDKPLYQPGQLVHMRALCLAAGNLQPRATEPLTFEVMDAKGNKVFKHRAESDAYGIGSAEFQLASEVNLGDYIVRAILGDTESEKQISVERYVLPKFKVNVKTDRDYYLPGETLKGEVQSDYFFGKPVAGGKVTVVGSKFEVEFEEFAELEGELDENGHWEFELPLPRYFAGTPIEQGNASVRLEVLVTDTADHREEKVAMTPVAAAPLVIHGVPESGALVPGLENRVYLLVAYPDGTPAKAAQVLVTGSSLKQRLALDTDDLGIAQLTLTPQDAAPVQLQVRVRDKQGRNAEQNIELSTKPEGQGLIVRTDKALYQVGDTLRAEVFAAKPKGNVYFDLIREGQTVMTRAAELENGRASMALDLDATVSGSVALQAYVFTSGTDIIRDSRRLYINPADALRMAIALNKDTYKPGEQATVDFTITNEDGAPTPAAIGLSIVDESVFALQEMHPGLEKVYFTLEQEIMKPRFEIHGYEINTLVRVPEGIPLKEGPAVWNDTQQKAARVLLASTPEPPAPPVRLNTFDEKNRQALEAVADRYVKDMEHIQRAVKKYLEHNKMNVRGDVLKDMLRRKYLRQNEVLDPWGTPYEFDFTHVVDWGGYFTMLSYGPDGVKGTDDDLSPETAMGRQILAGRGHAQRLMWNEDRNRLMPIPPLAPAAMPMMMKRGAVQEGAVALDAVMELADVGAVTSGLAGGGAPAEGPAPPRLREYFPETLLFEPALITDANGRVSLDIDLADSITTWRMTAMASSSLGALGSKDTPMRVFQDFFVDLDLPMALTQHDQVSIPVVLYNYLGTDQQVRLKFEQEPWFKLDGDAERTIQLAPEEVTAMYFPIEVVELGHHRLTVYAYGEKMSDAIRREIEILPDGEEQNVTFSDRLSDKVEHTVSIPPNAVEGASKILVRVYPGVFSQIVDGLDSMLRMPFGCFEQTSSVCYPNILIVQYMKETEQINPEIQMKAEGFINAGYQRLLAYEVQGGGFEWFGNPPANRILTAWGLKEFYDMAQVHEVDPAVIERTRTWLLNQQEANGSWKPDENYLHAESWTGIQKSDVLVTAYIAEAILSTGDKGPSMQKAIDYLKANWKDSQEPYTVALVANAFAAWNPKDAYTAQVLQKLYDLRTEEKEIAYWKSGAGTVTFTHGDAADVETTALAAIAFLRSGKYPEVTTKALTYLIQKKSAQGHWGSTQATILALKALTLSLGSQTEEVNATITVAVNGENVSELEVTPDDSDVMRLVDLGEQTKPGNNRVSLAIDGAGSMLYQIVGRYYTPWDVKQPREAPMTIEVEYDKQELAVNDLITATVRVKNNRREAAQMIIVDLGIPPGFQVMTPDLEELVQQGVMQKYELTGRQIITYFERIDGNATIEFSYGLQAKFPLRAQTPQSKVYEYYNPEQVALAAPQELVVE